MTRYFYNKNNILISLNILFPTLKISINKKQASLLKADLFFIYACYQAFS